MEPAGQMFVSSTYWGETVGLAAAIATLTELRNRDACKTIHQTGRMLKQRLTSTAADVGLNARCVGIDYHPHLEFAISDPDLKNKVGTLYVQEMAKRGCHGYTSFYINAAQGDPEVEQTTAAAREVFTLIAEALDAGIVDEKLEAQDRQEFFRRLVT